MPEFTIGLRDVYRRPDGGFSGWRGVQDDNTGAIVYVECFDSSTGEVQFSGTGVEWSQFIRASGWKARP